MFKVGNGLNSRLVPQSVRWHVFQLTMNKDRVGCALRTIERNGAPGAPYEVFLVNLSDLRTFVVTNIWSFLVAAQRRRVFRGELNLSGLG
jgi:hypothetical protein